jgi:hypothetical protein
VRLAVLAECCDARLEPIRAADLLKLGWNLAVAPSGVIAAIAADQLILAGGAVFRPAVRDTGWPLPEAERPFLFWPVTYRHVCLPRNGSAGEFRTSPERRCPVGSPSQVTYS